MTADTEITVSPAQVRPPPDGAARMLAVALRLFVHGLAVLAVAVALAVAQTLEVWMGALVVALVLMLLAAAVAVVGVVSRLRPRHFLWS